MNIEDNYSDCSLKISQDQESFSDWNGACYNCEYCFEDNDDVMSLFNMAEIWFTNVKDEDNL